MISLEDIGIVRSIAGAGDDYSRIKELVGATTWEIEADDTDLGFVRIFIPDAEDEFYRLITVIAAPSASPTCCSHFTLSPNWISTWLNSTARFVLLPKH
jgi:hypothetical protein